MTKLLLQTLGYPEIRGESGPIKLNLRKGLALLVYLAETQGAVARDVMATLLWPDSPRETALTRLRRMLHRIELALGQPVFETELVHTSGETRVGEPRFCDERGELSVGSALRGSFRHLRCGLLPFGPRGPLSGPAAPGSPVSSPFGLPERRECSGE